MTALLLMIWCTIWQSAGKADTTTSSTYPPVDEMMVWAPLLNNSSFRLPAKSFGILLDNRVSLDLHCRYIWSIPLLRRASLSPWSSFSRKRRSSAWQICFCSTHDLVRFFLLVTMHWFVACLLMGMVPSQTGTITIHVPAHCIKWLVTDSTIEDELLKT